MKTHESTKEDFPTRIASFLSGHRTVLMIVGAILIVGIFGAVGAYQIVENRADRAARDAELLLQDWEAWQGAADDSDERSGLEESIRNRAASLQEDHQRSYGALRSWHVLASLEWQLGNYSDSRQAFEALASRFPESHLAPIALAGAAAAAEEAGDISGARELLLQLADGTAVPSAERRRALFNLGRLAEESGELPEALGFYNRLVDEFPSDNWTNLGRNRIIALTVQGVRGDT